MVGGTEGTQKAVRLKTKEARRWQAGSRRQNRRIQKGGEAGRAGRRQKGREAVGEVEEAGKESASASTSPRLSRATLPRRVYTRVRAMRAAS